MIGLQVAIRRHFKGKSGVAGGDHVVVHVAVQDSGISALPNMAASTDFRSLDQIFRVRELIITLFGLRVQ